MPSPPSITIALLLMVAPAAASAASADAPLRVVLKDEAPYFNPRRIRVAAGSTIVWENRGPALVHTVVMTLPGGKVRSGSIRPGETFEHTFAPGESAVVKAVCEVHPYMYGIVIVGEPDDALIAAVESSVGDRGEGLRGRILEFELPVEGAVPGIVAVDGDDNVWFTLGGGGFANIEHPPLSKIGRMTLDGDLTVFTLPTPAAGTSGLTLGADGSVWVTELFGNKVARLDPQRRIVEEYPVPTPEAWPTGLALDADGNLWFNETLADKLARLSPSGEIVEIPVPTAASRATGLVIGPEGSVWIAERGAAKVGRLTPEGTFVEYALPTPGARPTGMTVDESGRLWVAERGGNKLAVIEDGRVREYPLPGTDSAPFFPVVDRDGYVWFTEMFANRIGRLDPRTGDVLEYDIPTPDSWPLGLATDSQGNLWFTEQLGNKVGVLLRDPSAVSGAAEAPAGAARVR